MEKTIVLNGNQLHKIAHKTHTAVVTMTSLALRERFRRYSDLYRTKSSLLSQGEKIVEADYNQVWKDLENAGIGHLIYGRRGNPDRFMWHYNLKNVAQAALEGKSQESSTLPEVVKKKPGRPPKVKPVVVKEPSETKQIIFPLRKNFNIEIKVPSDITKEEAEDIGNVLKIIIK